MAILPFMLVVNILFFSSQISWANDKITQFQSLVDGRTLVSQDGTFELGFFNPGSSTNSYLGIWFKNVPLKTFVWVANRDHPIINDKSGKLSISKEGNLVLLSNNGIAHWSTNATTKGSSVIAQLLDSGNFVLRDEKDNDPKGYLWQSFDYPTDTILPGMKLRVNLTSGLDTHLTAWKNWDDPSSGHLIYGFKRSNIPRMEMWNGTSMLYRSGPWNGNIFSATHSLLFDVVYENNKDEYYLRYKPKDLPPISRIVINQTVYALQRFKWIERNQTWTQYEHANIPNDDCDNYKRCGSFGICAMKGESPVCECLKGFAPKSPQNWSEGCVRNETWGCKEKNKDGFNQLQNMKLPDTNKSWIDRSMTLEECKARCWENCSCMAYANSDITGDGSGCIIWFDDLLDLRRLKKIAGQDLYVRLAVSQIAFTFIYWRSITKSRGNTRKVKKNESKHEDLELPLFDFDTIACATNDFSNDNKLGEGGFGPVYRGTLPDGQNVAVKRLSHSSTQGIKEFKNEAWSLWKECNALKFIDTYLEGSYIPSEALRCIHIGLLCVQHQPDDRPTMSSVLLMLTSESILPQPKEPAFLIEKDSSKEESTSGQKMYHSTNEVTVSVLEPR
ncbi:S-locus glycoprotein domain [Sesbania bispinosa]|nr:S-locus glycoprotein domain [Sesbania bispinosa]